MHIQRADRDHMELGEMDFLCARFILQIVPSASTQGDPAAERRLYSSPSEGREREFDQDWKNYVEPDLRNLFKNAQEIVAADIGCFDPDEADQSTTLRIPVKNLEAWISVLNQARLAIWARHDFSEEEMEERISVGDDTRSLALFQVHFYGFLQECFLQQLD